MICEICDRFKVNFYYEKKLMLLFCLNKLNGYLTQGENIADNGGLKQSFRVNLNLKKLKLKNLNYTIIKAYQKWTETHGHEPLLPGLDYTQNQLFFINYGQIWCGKYRNQSLLLRIMTAQHAPGEFR